jgi:hypothetical protein
VHQGTDAAPGLHYSLLTIRKELLSTLIIVVLVVL